MPISVTLPTPSFASLSGNVQASTLDANFAALVVALATAISTGELPITVAQGGTGRITQTPNTVLSGNGTGAPVEVGPMQDGEVIIGRSGQTPTSAQITGGPGVTIATGPGLIQIQVASAQGQTLGQTLALRMFPFYR